MRYAILLQQRPDGRYQATVPALPGVVSAGITRDEALLHVRQAIADTLATAELVYIDISAQVSAPINPWLATAGVFADDPTLEPMLQEIYAARDAE